MVKKKFRVNMDNYNHFTVKKNPLIKNYKGNIIKFISKEDINFFGFGEIYFSYVKKNKIKAWKLNHISFSNMMVIRGRVLFVTYKKNSFNKIIITDKNRKCISIPNKLIYGFMGLEKTNLIVNMVNKKHSDKNNKKIDLSEIKFNWSKFQI